MKRVLFICKQNENYGYSTTGKRSGLFNSTRFVAEALVKAGFAAQVVEVKDNNGIDREVTAFKPDIVVIEALWVVPDKFTTLRRLHPNVKWYVHLHSNIPFLALEGIAMQWIATYDRLNIGIIVNSPHAFAALETIVSRGNLTLLGNVYSGEFSKLKPATPGRITIGCFGAVRPMKNQLIQALAAIKFARANNLALTFMINAGRSETGGDPVLKNLVELFKYPFNGTLVRCPWFEHDAFMQLLRTEVDLGMQVSLSETFNIVSADCVTAGVPVVVSDEIEWSAKGSQAPTDNVDDIVACMLRVYRSDRELKRNQRNLTRFVEESTKAWISFINPPTPRSWVSGLFT